MTRDSCTIDRIRVLTIDDHAAFRSAARGVIEATPGFEAIGEAADGELGQDDVVVLVSADEAWDLPQIAQFGGTVPFVRKQDFGPRLLRQLWRECRR